MPTYLSEGDICELRVNYVQNGQRLLNIFHYVAEGIAPASDYESAMIFVLSEFTEGLTQWPAKWDDSASEQISIYKVECQKIFPTRLFHVSKLVDIPGSVLVSAHIPLPQNVQLSLTKVTAETGRGRTGRVEVPGATDELIEEGRLNVDGNLWMESLAVALKTPIPTEMLTGAQLVPVVLNAFAPAGSPKIELVRVQDTVRVARRRTVGVGE